MIEAWEEYAEAAETSRRALGNKVVCVGDSVTSGQHVHPSKAWPSLLRQRFPCDLIVNKGVAGDTTRLALERFPLDVQVGYPDIVLIQFGHNDCNRWDTDRGLPRVSLRAFEANLLEMEERCRKFGVEIVAFLAPYATRRGEQYERDRSRYVRAIESLRWLSDGEPEVSVLYPDPGDGLMDDGLHLNETGHERYAEGVEKWLATIL